MHIAPQRLSVKELVKQQKKLHLYLVSKFLLQIDTASCLEMAEKLELYVEHQLNRSFYIVVDCETFLAALAALYLPLSVS